MLYWLVVVFWGWRVILLQMGRNEPRLSAAAAAAAAAARDGVVVVTFSCL